MKTLVNKIALLVTIASSLIVAAPPSDICCKIAQDLTLESMTCVLDGCFVTKSLNVSGRVYLKGQTLPKVVMEGPGLILDSSVETFEAIAHHVILDNTEVTTLAVYAPRTGNAEMPVVVLKNGSKVKDVVFEAGNGLVVCVDAASKITGTITGGIKKQSTCKSRCIAKNRK